MILGIFSVVGVSFLGWCVYCASCKERILNKRIASELNRVGAWDEHPRNQRFR